MSSTLLRVSCAFMGNVPVESLYGLPDTYWFRFFPVDLLIPSFRISFDLSNGLVEFLTVVETVLFPPRLKLFLRLCTLYWYSWAQNGYKPVGTAIAAINQFVRQLVYLMR